ncbi:GNAT family N-acetyltransferase [Chitinophaga sp. 212800010-3]|uniref:GNAT family N-acetyltransferase n=1 Tax=unclassified Chitinophaga TaxID=2619133 RepID=UPI002DF3B928|nr:N-acetyltransferase domain-containing protein [Chitinophaga sp. 212800010-3]
MDTLNYREASKGDTEAIRDLSLRSYDQFAAVLEPEHWEKMNQAMSNMEALATLMSSAITFVCETRETLAGVIFLVPSGNPTDVYPADWAYIRRLAVAPAQRGRGIGRQLTEMCINRARSGGEKILGLHTSTMMPDARHIYSKLGFGLVQELGPMLGQQYWLYRMDL